MHNFQDYINPICDCGLEISISEKHDEFTTKVFLYGNEEFDLSSNSKSVIP